MCPCDLCTREEPIKSEFVDGNMLSATGSASTRWLKKLLDSLSLSGAKTLKLNLPDILFVIGESFETFQTSRKDGRLIKLSGTTPLKSLFATMVRYCKEYKYML